MKKSRHLKAITPRNRQLFNDVKAGFMRQGTSFNRFCTENGLTRQNVEQALLGQRAGKKAKFYRNVALAAAKAHKVYESSVAARPSGIRYIQTPTASRIFTTSTCIAQAFDLSLERVSRDIQALNHPAISQDGASYQLTAAAFTELTKNYPNRALVETFLTEFAYCENYWLHVMGSLGSEHDDSIEQLLQPQPTIGAQS